MGTYIKSYRYDWRCWRERGEHGWNTFPQSRTYTSNPQWFCRLGVVESCWVWAPHEWLRKCWCLQLMAAWHWFCCRIQVLHPSLIWINCRNLNTTKYYETPRFTRELHICFFFCHYEILLLPMRLLYSLEVPCRMSPKILQGFVTSHPWATSLCVQAAV